MESRGGLGKTDAPSGIPGVNFVPFLVWNYLLLFMSKGARRSNIDGESLWELDLFPHFSFFTLFTQKSLATLSPCPVTYPLLFFFKLLPCGTIRVKGVIPGMQIQPSCDMSWIDAGKTPRVEDDAIWN